MNESRSRQQREGNKTPGTVAHPLDRLTIRYVPTEDRIRMTCALKEAETLDFWFTQRILNGLINGLTGWLESNPAETTPVPSQTPASAQTGQQLAREQVSAQMTMRPAKPVRPSSSSRDVLVTRLAVKTRQDALILELTINDREKGLASFSRTTLNQWLGILYRQYLEAQWPVDVWPAWFKDAQTRPAQLIGAEIH